MNQWFHWSQHPIPTAHRILQVYPTEREHFGIWRPAWSGHPPVELISC
jgi:hypothetical protein